MRLSPRAAVTGSPSRGWLAAMTAILVVTAAAGVTAAWADVSRAATALGSSWYGSAPYDMPLDNSPPALTQVLAATGQKAYTLAFVLAQNNSACAPAW
ncbi:MAG: hypothetical protein ACM3ML_06350, partial [Micromonosporaceae bacterium]